MINDRDVKSAFISYGEQCKMYTLHEIYHIEKVINGIKVKTSESRYVKNLANDRERAIQKAIEYAASRNIEFVSTDGARKELFEIKRQRTEDILRSKEEAEKRRLEEEERYINEMLVVFEDQFQSNSFTFGKYTGKTFQEVLEKDAGYVKYIIENSQLPHEHPRNLNDICANSLYSYVDKNGYPERPEDNSEFIGAKGDRIKVNVKVIKKMSFDSMYGIKTMYHFMDENNNVFVTFYSGNTWKLDVGDTATIKGTIDKHQTYDNVKQTHIKRVKVM